MDALLEAIASLGTTQDDDVKINGADKFEVIDNVFPGLSDVT